MIESNAFKVLISCAVLAVGSGHLAAWAQDSAGTEQRAASGAEAAPAGPQKRGYLGLRFDYEDDPGRPGYGRLRVVGTVSGTPAEKAGLTKDDLIIAFNGVEFGFASEIELLQAFSRLQAGDDVELTVLRGDDTLTIEIVAAPIPPEVEARQKETFALLARNTAVFEAMEWINSLNEDGREVTVTVKRSKNGEIEVQDDGFPPVVSIGLRVLFAETEPSSLVDSLAAGEQATFKFFVDDKGTPLIDRIP